MNWKIALIIFFSFVIILFLGSVFYYSYQVRNFQTQNSKNLSFEIKKGQGFIAISDNLFSKNLINKPFILKLYLLISGDGKKLQAGSYEIEPGMSLQKLVYKFVNGKVASNKLVLLEGWRFSQVQNAMVKNNLMDSESLDSALSESYQSIEEFKKIDPKFSGNSFEGIFFPDTYLFNKDTKNSEIVKTIFDNFKKKTSDFQILQSSSSFSPYEVLILASIVEREVKSFSDRKLVASVFINRLKKGIKLQADPTVQYAKGDTWPTITQADYKDVNSPYNTYLNDGLPPTPICNPSLSSIKAVVLAPKTSYFYFFNTEDGSTIFSQTIEEHLEKQKSY